MLSTLSFKKSLIVEEFQGNYLKFSFLYVILVYFSHKELSPEQIGVLRSLLEFFRNLEITHPRSHFYQFLRYAFCCQIHNLVCFFSLDNRAFLSSFHRNCSNKSASLIPD